MNPQDLLIGKKQSKAVKKKRTPGLQVRIEVSKKNPDLIRPLVSGTYRGRTFEPVDKPPSYNLGLVDFEGWRLREDLRNRTLATATDGKGHTPALRKHIGDLAHEALKQHAEGRSR